jgi:hypothetical protein
MMANALLVVAGMVGAGFSLWVLYAAKPREHALPEVGSWKQHESEKGEN